MPSSKGKKEKKQKIKRTRAYVDKKNPTILHIEISPASREFFREILREEKEDIHHLPLITVENIVPTVPLPFLSLGEPAIPLEEEKKNSN